MKQTLLFFFLCGTTIACTQRQTTNNEQNIEQITLKENPKHHNNDRNKKYTVTPDFNSIFPKSDTELEEWKRKVREEGDTSYFQKLTLCNVYNKGIRKEGHKGYDISDDQMRHFADIMVTKHLNNIITSDNYKYQYIKYTELDESLMKEDVVKALEYANDLLKSINDTKNATDELIAIQAREFITKQYKEGKYIQKDIIIASYLENGGTNLDSIIQARTATP